MHEIHHTKLSKIWILHGTSVTTNSNGKQIQGWYEVTYFVTPSNAPSWRSVFAPSGAAVVTKVHTLTMLKRPDLDDMLRNRMCPMPKCDQHAPLQGGPLCAAHTASRYHVRVGPSTISGLGLFATERISHKDDVCRTLPYGGEIITNKLFALRYPDGTEPTFVVDVKRNEGKRVLFRVDGEYQRDIGTLVNSNAGTALANNAQLQDANLEALVHAMDQTLPRGSAGSAGSEPPVLPQEVCPVDVRIIHDVEQNGELLASYGKEYDDALKQTNAETSHASNTTTTNTTTP